MNTTQAEENIGGFMVLMMGMGLMWEGEFKRDFDLEEEVLDKAELIIIITITIITTITIIMEVR